MLYFLCGLSIGLVICLWKYYQINIQLTDILHSLSQFEPVTSLSKIAQVRRNVNLLNNRYYYTQLELDLHRYLINKINLGYLRINEENCLIECNEEAKKLLHIHRWNPEILRLFLELVRSYELDQLIQQTRKIQQNLVIEWQFFPTANYILEEENNLEIENYKPVFLKAYSYPLPAGQVSIFIENKQLIKELSIRRDEAYSDLSHELRTPLTSLSLLAETLLKYTDNKGKIWVQQMSQEINRLIDLVQNWLEISTLEQSPYEMLKFQNLDLKQLIFSAWQSLKILADQEKISLEYKGEEKIIISADINRLTQVFVNLFDNSIKHGSPHSLISVNVEIKYSDFNNQFLEINIIDSGSGFNTNDLPYIFDRLYRGDKSRVRNTRGGSGLGLSIVKQIVEAHQGTIIANNHPETKGAWFKITLPMKIK
ncbi:cell wall metabolism sensor histidine kinase WalK [Geminocystis sp. NIES-3709]|uniref:sensor histidine kinase n=1 Tax=Geminocystis sp. NIES-3709 TaxID=1617448 RepID=UPI0005FCBCD6|nr:HAMP domain-containing sensor histidine kinase [Geminocystis sp. NIES-3709]BAQ63363.1 phosphate regulon sensor protein PhoR [Geminocystis sp. NIES-3709]